MSMWIVTNHQSLLSSRFLPVRPVVGRVFDGVYLFLVLSTTAAASAGISWSAADVSAIICSVSTLCFRCINLWFTADSVVYKDVVTMSFIAVFRKSTTWLAYLPENKWTVFNVFRIYNICERCIQQYKFTHTHTHIYIYIFMSLRIWHLWDNSIFGLRRLIKDEYLFAINEIGQLSKLSLNIYIHWRSYPSKLRSFIHSYLYIISVKFEIRT